MSLPKILTLTYENSSIIFNKICYNHSDDCIVTVYTTRHSLGDKHMYIRVEINDKKAISYSSMFYVHDIDLYSIVVDVYSMKYLIMISSDLFNDYILPYELDDQIQIIGNTELLDMFNKIKTF